MLRHHRTFDEKQNFSLHGYPFALTRGGLIGVYLWSFPQFCRGRTTPKCSAPPLVESPLTFGGAAYLPWQDSRTPPSSVETSLLGALGARQQDTAAPRPARYWRYFATSGFRMLITSLSNSLGSNPRISLRRRIFSNGIPAVLDSMPPTKLPYRYFSIFPNSACVHPFASLACLILFPSLARASHCSW